jgi:hypothetical protein
MLAMMSSPSRTFLNSQSDAESVLLCAPVIATWAAVQLREKLPHFCSSSVGKKILLKASPVAKEEICGPLINNVSREQIAGQNHLSHPMRHRRSITWEACR